MRLLLDTHVFLWLKKKKKKCSPNILQLCENRENYLFISYVSLWEIQIKQQLGKLELLMPLPELVESSQRDHALVLLPIETQHIYTLSSLPRFHQDPFDRLLIAQAMQESMALASVDKNIRACPVDVVW